jgi:hypothetical protein
MFGSTFTNGAAQMAKAQLVVEGSSFMLDEFKVKAESLVARLERVKQEHDARWGIKRIEMLVDANLRLKLTQQLERVFNAQRDRDIEKMEKAIAGMIKGYGVLDAWAEDNNIEVKPEINAVEWVMQDKSIMVVVQTHNDAIYYQQFRPELSNRHIWSMEELELLLESDVIKDIMKAKALLPGTRMTRIAAGGGATGFDDLPDCDIDLSGDLANPLFNFQHAKMMKAPA